MGDGPVGGRAHGTDGAFYIAQQMDRMLADGDLDGLAMWRKARDRFKEL